VGETYRLSCKCGYAKELNLGGGLAACNINMVTRVFLEEKLKEFNTYYINKEVQSFLVENELSLCDKCKKIMITAVLKVQLTNNKKLQIINDCPSCSNKIRIITDSPMCPKCGQEMIKEEIGQWD